MPINALVSIVIPVFNREEFLIETVNSIVQQTYTHWELLLVDDGSTDRSIQIAQEFSNKDARIKSIQRDRAPKGAPTCRNIGLDRAIGKYVIFLDSDDLMAPYCLTQRLKKVSDFPENDFWVFPMMIFEKTVYDTRRLTNINSDEGDLYRFLRSDIVWQTAQPIWSKASLVKLGGFDEEFPNCQDHDLHLRAIIEGLAYRKFLDEKPDTFYRKHNSEKIYKPSDPLRVLKGINKLFTKLALDYSDFLKDDEEAIRNIRPFLFRTLRMYTRNGVYDVPSNLSRLLFQNGLVAKIDFVKLRLYVSLSAKGFNRVRGFEKLWNLIIHLDYHSMTWGQTVYSKPI
ncbi:glycosyltransferase family 2 protein [Roseivirga spongicola]|uniref:glycosyltransferase family 2 protein n=1 Tax=Roseivirga spongicola TaxID=333140 RepID=UPI002AC89D81|nr:glycosyltransferase [Roseivirga spongicola]WPZ09170.1 glycosyltransferase [Roseivirga spongicola]